MLKKVIILQFLLLFYNCFFIYAQNESINTIISNLDTISNSEQKIDILLNNCELFFSTSPDSAMYFCNIAFTELSKSKNNYRAVEIFTNSGILCTYRGEIENALHYYFTGLNYSKNSIDSAEFFTNIANCYVYKSEYNTAYEYFEKSKDIFQKMNYTNGLVNFLINTGVTYSQQGFKQKAMIQYLEALNLYEDSIDLESRAILYQNLGTLMAEQGDLLSSEEYFNQALEIYQKQKNIQNICDILINLALIKIDEIDYSKSEKILDEALEISENANLNLKKAYILFVKGQLFILEKNYNKAVAVFLESLKIREDAGGEYDLISSYISLAEVYFKLENYKTSEYYAQKAIVKTNKINALELQIEVNKILSDIYSKNYKYEKAYNFLYTSKTLTDSLFEIQQTKAILELEIIYQTEKKQKEIQILKYEKELQSNELEQKRRNIIAIIAVSVFCLIFLLIIQYVIRQKQNLEHKRKIVYAAVDAEEKIKDEIARELHDNIAGRLMGIITQIISENKKVNYLSEIRKIYNEIRQLSHSLAEPMFIDVTISEKLQALADEIQNKNNLNITFYSGISIDWMTIKQNQEIQKALYRITQELINNTLKYANATEIEIQLIDSENVINYIYSDNGIGFEKESINKGIGFENIEKRTKSLNGNCEINSNLGCGLTIALSIPFYKLNHQNGKK